jgi:tRNA nucleotidyltransferase/poly(A) polymerase/predicted alpha/beta hydrolase family esterase
MAIVNDSKHQNMTTDSALLLLQKIQTHLPQKIYAVGGMVRNSLRGLEIEDLDCATSLVVDQVVTELEGKPGVRIQEVLPNFGVIKLLIDCEGSQVSVEIATFRKEVYSRRSRFPEVEFVTNLEIDAARRDFTINSLYMDAEGTIYDFYNGSDDLEVGVLKTVNDPLTSFQDDPLRMLRAGRFISEYGFTPDSSWEGIVPNFKTELYQASKATWVKELDRILAGVYVRHGLNYLQYYKLFDILIPELSSQLYLDQNTPYHDFDLWNHTLNVVEDTPRGNLNLRWAALLHDIAKPFTQTRDLRPDKHVSHFHNHEIMGEELARGAAQRLQFSSERTEYIAKVIRLHLKSGTELKAFDDKRKRLPSGYNKPMIVMVSGGETFETYEDYIEDLRTQELRLGGISLWPGWLEKEVEPWYNFFKVSRPNSDNAQYEEWKIRFERCQEFFSGELVLIGWSLGAIFLLKYLSQERHDLDITEVHLVAPPYPHCDSFSLQDGWKLQGITSDRVHVYHSQDDCIVPFIEGKQLAQDLNLMGDNFVEFEDRSHFLQKKFPELLERLMGRIDHLKSERS